MSLCLEIDCYIQGVPKKTHVLGFLFITPTWKGLGTKVGCVLKNSGNFLFVDTKIFQFDMLEVEKFGSKDGNPPKKS